MSAGSPAIPPKIKNAASPLKFFASVILGFVTLCALAVLFFFDPSTHGFYPVCQFHQLTGLNCPGCGATRALYALLHGNFLLALKDNALFIFTLAAFLIWGANLALRKLRNQRTAFDLPPKILWTFLVVTIVFTTLRNLPAFSFLSP
jgi:Protein of unknown function (DUF2752)